MTDLQSATDEGRDRMTTEASSDTSAPPATPPRQITMDDVHRLVGALFLELESVRRENAYLRGLLDGKER